MANIFTLENVENFSEKLNIDELYEKKRQHDVNQLALFNKILNRVHVRIKTASRQKVDFQSCWFIVPETIIGVPKYDQAQCIAYIIDKLKTNGFNVRYIHPNALFISWNHFVPSYIRSELKKKTGIVIDGKGNKIEKNESSSQEKISSDPDELMFQRGNKLSIENKTNKDYKSIDSYKPSGNLIYNESLLKRIEEKSKSNI